MSIERAAVALRQQQNEAGMRLLRSSGLPWIAAVLHEHLGTTQRVMLAPEFIALLDGDIDMLRQIGFDIPRNPVEYLSEWVRNGWVVRKPGAGPREETVELSPAAQITVRFIIESQNPRSSVTSSRLNNVINLLATLAQDTDSNPATRLEVLLAQQEKIAADIAAVQANNFKVITDDEALERLAEIIRLSGEIPGDFARVSADLDELNRDLHTRLINQSGSKGEVLEHMFVGINEINDSDWGRSFNAFYELLTDQVQGAILEEATNQVLGRAFTETLTTVEKFSLQRLLDTLQRESGQVRTTMTSFSRGLRHLVETRAYQESYRLQQAINEARMVALKLLQSQQPFTKSNYELPGTSIALRSVGSWRLYHPEDLRSPAEVEVAPTAKLDLEQLRQLVRASEIDFYELKAAIAATVSSRGSATIGDVLADHPATQGLASVIGLVWLAYYHAIPVFGAEQISWVSKQGNARAVMLDRYLFDKPIEERSEA
ncbi:MAG: DUF3375 domain-containing protein [Propionibacteriaceae bacterium]|jgi:hypothetical protein|nr:DUF3375 domain-containing protein [Propionibacteriaceae bacterium]